MTLAKTSWFAEDALNIHAPSYKTLFLTGLYEFIYSCTDKGFRGTSYKAAPKVEGERLPGRCAQPGHKSWGEKGRGTGAQQGNAQRVSISADPCKIFTRAAADCNKPIQECSLPFGTRLPAESIGAPVFSRVLLFQPTPARWGWPAAREPHLISVLMARIVLKINTRNHSSLSPP